MIKNLFFLILYLFSFGTAASAFFLKLVFYLKDPKKLWRLNLLILISFMTLLSFLITLSFYIHITVEDRSGSLLILVLNILQALFFALLFPVVPYAFARLLGIHLRIPAYVWMFTSALLFFSGYLYSILSDGNLIILVTIKVYLLLFLYFFIYKAWRQLKLINNRRLRNSVRNVLLISLLFLPPVTLEKVLYPALFENSILTGFEAPFLSIFLIWLALIDIRYLIPALSGTLVSTRLEEIDDSIFRDFTITEREKEIILMVERGMLSKQIAGELNISLNTVNNHLSNIYRKTDSGNKTEMLRHLRDSVGN